MRVEDFKGGAFESPKDARDFQFSELISVGAVAPITDEEWDEGFDSEAVLGIKLKRENQNGSSSCVAQATSKVGEGLNYLETKQLMDFSAKRIYSNIFLPDGGAYTTEGAKWAINYGFLPEEFDKSYENGNAPSEEYIRQRKVLSPAEKTMEKVFSSASYFFAYDIDAVATAIKNSYFIIMSANGDSQGWRTGDLLPPVKVKWGHAFVGKGFQRKVNPNTGTKMKAIKFLNSWGTWGYGGDGWMYEDYFTSGNVHTALVLVDKKNLITMGLIISLVKTANLPAVYLVGLGDGLYHPLHDGQFAKDLFGKEWKDMKISVVPKIEKEKIGYTIGKI
jgi:hypothetical protein